MNFDPVTNWLRAAKWWLIAGAVVAATVYHLFALHAARSAGHAAGVLEEQGRQYQAITKAITDATEKYLTTQATVDRKATVAREKRNDTTKARGAAVAVARAHLEEQNHALDAAADLAVPVEWLHAIDAARSAARTAGD